MAFPQVEDVTDTAFASGGTTRAVNYPTTVSSGDLLILAYIWHSDDASTAAAADFIDLIASDSNNTCRWFVAARKGAGTEGGGTFNVVHGTGTPDGAVARIIRVSAWGGTLTDPFNASDDLDISGTSTTGNNAPNPFTVTAGWGSDDNLFIAIEGHTDDDVAVTAYPTDYSSGTYTISGGGNNSGAAVSSAYRELAADTDNPDTFTLASTEDTVSWTIVVKPGSSGGGGGASTILPLINAYYG